MKGKHIVVSDEVYNYLVEQGHKNESFDQILRRLLHPEKSDSGGVAVE